ncbi:MAG: thioredoxin family protein [bacterium]|nr:thioredoxin family protein [bacterium]
MNKNNKQRGFSRVAIIGIVAAVVVVVIMFGYFVNSKQSQKDVVVVPVSNTTNRESMREGISEEKDLVGADAIRTDSMIKKDDSRTTEKTDPVVKPGSYEAYSADKIARAETGDVVLFFHAAWCPSCRTLNTSIENNLKSIPVGVTILKTDYDKETELKKKYGVTYQHTLVQVDKDGNLIKKWSGGATLANLLSQIQ